MRKQDRLFLHSLTIREARTLLPQLRNLARAKFPGVPTIALGVKIDYARVPPVPSVFKLEGHNIATATLDDPVIPTSSTLNNSSSVGLVADGMAGPNKFDGARSREAQEKARQRVNTHYKGELSHERMTGILKKAMDNRERMTLIESVVSQGETAIIVLTLSAKSIWLEGDRSEGGNRSIPLDEDWVNNGEDIDEETIEKARNIIDVIARRLESGMGLN